MNSRRGGVEFEVDGAAYVLRLTTNAQVRFQDVEGKTLLRSLVEMETGEPDIRLMRAVFQHCTTPVISAEAAGDIMDELGLLRSAQLINDAGKLAFPQAEDQTADPQTAPSLTILSATG